jgi:lipopolysaccharide export system protein LptA
MKLLPLGLLFLSLSGPALVAQTISGVDSTGSDLLSTASPTPAPAKKAAAAAPQGPTIIESQAMDYDEKTRLAIFTGEDYGVYVKDPSFVVYCDKLTAHMRKGSGPAAPGTPGAAKATPAPAAKGAAAPQKANGLQSAIAEGALYRPVVIVQDKPASGTDEAQHNVGIAQKADYNADTGDVKLTGWPRVSQGIDTQIATSESTIMIMNKDGKTMRTIGPSRTVIQEQDQTKKPDSSSSPTQQ